MFVPVLDEEEDDELRNPGEDEVVRVEFVEDMVGVVIIKINNVLLALSLCVATFIHFCTLEPRYLNSLMWGSQDEDGFLTILSEPSKSLLTFQSILATMLLCFLRAFIFANLNNNVNNTSTFEAVLKDTLFHIKVRFGVGLLVCSTPLSFPQIETTVVCLSVVLQLASSSV